MAAPCTTLSGEWAESGNPWPSFSLSLSFWAAWEPAAFAQPYTMSTAVQNSLGIPAWITTVAAAVICGVVLLGGVKSIGGFCEKLTPAMCLIYVVGVLGVIIINLEHVPAAFAAIFRYAFAPMPAVGGLAGSTVALALRQGRRPRDLLQRSGLRLIAHHPCDRHHRSPL